jgi:hypothetical protein
MSARTLVLASAGVAALLAAAAAPARADWDGWHRHGWHHHWYRPYAYAPYGYAYVPPPAVYVAPPPLVYVAPPPPPVYVAPAAPSLSFGFTIR